MSSYYHQPQASSVAIILIENKDYPNWLKQQSQSWQCYLKNSNFQAEKANFTLLFDQESNLQSVLVIYSNEQYKVEYIADLAFKLPNGNYHLENFSDNELVHLGWGMGSYQFTKYKKATREPAKLLLAESLIAVQHRCNAIYLARDLINTPAEDMTPNDIALAAKQLAAEHNAEYNCVNDQKLLAEQFPAVYTVGKGSVNPSCLIELNWGDKAHPLITIIGKGVSFDTGGVNIKPDAGMRLMQKDMGGAANALALASYIMQQQLPVRLRLIIPSAENAVSGSAMRPGDIIRMRDGKTVEVDHTDAEGRLILADAITYATEKQQPEIMLTFATLTGAARVAVGTEIAAYFSNDDVLANELNQSAKLVDDPVWQLPLYQPYKRSLQTQFADLKNTGYPMGGATTAALFLQQFIQQSCAWIHFDIMAWNVSSRPGHPEGGEAMGIAASYAMIKSHLNIN